MKAPFTLLSTAALYFPPAALPITAAQPTQFLCWGSIVAEGVVTRVELLSADSSRDPKRQRSVVMKVDISEVLGAKDVAIKELTQSSVWGQGLAVAAQVVNIEGRSLEDSMPDIGLAWDANLNPAKLSSLLVGRTFYFSMTNLKQPRADQTIIYDSLIFGSNRGQWVREVVSGGNGVACARPVHPGT